jgi:hypothetical protein
MATDPHHVLGEYDSAFTERLCRKHHLEITQINSESSGPGYKLFVKERRRIYRAWKRGELKPIGNPADNPWMADWDA